MFKIDKIDYEIINALMEDGQVRAAEIARRLGNKSERAVRYRIDRLVYNKIIHLSAIINPKGLGLNVVADVLLEIESGLIMDVANKLAALENISYVACSIGETDVSIQVLGTTNAEIYAFVTEVVGKIPGVRKTTTKIVPVVLKDTYQWKLPASFISNTIDDQ